LVNKIAYNSLPYGDTFSLEKDVMEKYFGEKNFY
jgi:hypothetical protein